MRPPPETGSGSAPREEPTALRALRVSRRSRATHAAQPVHAHTRAVCAVPAASLNGVGASGRSTAPAGSALGTASPGFPAVRGSPPNKPRRCAPRRAPQAHPRPGRRRGASVLGAAPLHTASRTHTTRARAHPRGRARLARTTSAASKDRPDLHRECWATRYSRERGAPRGARPRRRPRACARPRPTS